MKTKRRPALVAATLLLTPAFAAHADEIFSPALPALGPSQRLECRIVNVTNVSQVVTIQSFDSTGAQVSNNMQTLASGQVGGVSIPTAPQTPLYCKFTVRGNERGYRASIDVLDTTTTPPTIVVALPAY